MKLQLTVLFLFVATALSWGSMARISDPRISPDGRALAFCWQGDVWVVPTTGGEARRLTVHPATESLPLWTPDGKQIVFASTRHGSADLFVMNADGTSLRRLTFESGSEAATSLSSDGRTLFGHTTSWGRTDLFRVPLAGGEMVRITGHNFEPEFSPSVSPDGRTVAYSAGGSSGSWRNPTEQSEGTAKIWLADNTPTLTNHKQVVHGDRWHLFPTFTQQNTILFVSNREGKSDLYEMRADGGNIRRLTNLPVGALRLPSVTQDGQKIAFQFNGRAYVLNRSVNNPTPAAVPISLPQDRLRNPETTVRGTTGVEEFSLSPDGKRYVVAWRGDLFLTTRSGGFTRRLTTNPGWDGSPRWLDDQRMLYVSAREQGRRELRTLTPDGKDELFLACEIDLVSPSISPDRKWVAFHRGMREIRVAPVDKPKESNLLVEGPFAGAMLGGPEFYWSSDSQWLTVGMPGERSTALTVVARDGSARHHLHRAGRASTPLLTPNGRTLLFTAVHGLNFSETRDSTSPLYALDLKPEPLRFSEDELDGIPKPEEARGFAFEPSGLEDRLRTVVNRSVSGFAVSPDGQTVFANVAGAFSQFDLRTGTVRPVGTATGSARNLEFSSDGNTLSYLQGGQLLTLNLRNNQVATVSLSFEATVNQEVEERALFDEIWWTLDRLYYDPKMHGHDWAALREEFAALLPTVQSRADFYSLASDMMDRLDSSHLGATPPSDRDAEAPESVGWLGVEWDWHRLAQTGALVVYEVYEGTPASHPDSLLRPGDRILKVNEKELGREWTLAQALTGTVGRRVTLQVQRGARELEIRIRPVSTAARSSVHYDHWVEWNRSEVYRLSNGRLGYMHIQGMNASSLDDFLREAQTKAEGKEGMVIDVRYNGGGYTAHIILNMLVKTPWLVRTQRDRPGEQFSENQWRGQALELPTVCLINRHSFSNAEIFAEGFRRLGIGRLVGEPTAGGVIGTSSRRLWDGGSIRLPGSGAFAIDGENLEGNGRRPDVHVPTDPNQFGKSDPQLAAAVRELLR